MIQLQNINFSRNNKKLFDNFSYTFPRNSITPIIGPSGCGKTTLINIVSGILSPQSGKIVLNYEEKSYLITRPSSKVLVMNQTYTNFPWVNCLENVLFKHRLNGKGSTYSKEKALNLLDSVGLIDFVDKYPGNLSGGMKQRLALARALYSCSPVIVMDEPLSALDEITRKKMQNLLIEQQEINKNIILVITHDLEEANILRKNNEILTLTRRD